MNKYAITFPYPSAGMIKLSPASYATPIDMRHIAEFFTNQLSTIQHLTVLGWHLAFCVIWAEVEGPSSIEKELTNRIPYDIESFKILNKS